MKLRNYYVRNGRYLPYKNLKAKEVSNIKVYDLGLSLINGNRTLNATELANLRNFLSKCDIKKDLIFFKALNGGTYIGSITGSVMDLDSLVLVLSACTPVDILQFPASANNIETLKTQLPLYLTITLATGVIEKLTFDDFYKSYQSGK